MLSSVGGRSRCCPLLAACQGRCQVFDRTEPLIAEWGPSTIWSVRQHRKRDLPVDDIKPAIAVKSVADFA